MPESLVNQGADDVLRLPEGIIPQSPSFVPTFEDYWDFLVFCLETFPPPEPVPRRTMIPFRIL
jgi:hypothetical protein